MANGNARASGAVWSRWVWLRVAGTCLCVVALLGCGAIQAPLTCPERVGKAYHRSAAAIRARGRSGQGLVAHRAMTIQLVVDRMQSAACGRSRALTAP